MAKTPSQFCYYRWLVLGYLLCGIILWQVSNLRMLLSPSSEAHTLNTTTTAGSPTGIIRLPPNLPNGTKNGTWPAINARLQSTKVTTTLISSVTSHHPQILSPTATNDATDVRTASQTRTNQGGQTSWPTRTRSLILVLLIMKLTVIGVIVTFCVGRRRAERRARTGSTMGGLNERVVQGSGGVKGRSIAVGYGEDEEDR